MIPEPPLVSRALELERELGFERSSIPEVGRLLHVLAAQRGRTRVGEIGSGCGVGAAWIVTALAPTVPFVTVELDEAQAAKLMRLIESLEDLDDVAAVHANFDVPSEVLERVAGSAA